MPAFLKPEGIYLDVSNKYKNSSEEASVSRPIEIDGKRYREIVFNKTFLGKATKKAQGFIYITEEGSVVSDERIQKEIARVAFYSRLIFDEAYSGNIKSAITPETKVIREEEENEIAIEGLNVLKEEGISGAAVLTEILSKLPRIKRENNIALETFINKLEGYKIDETVLSKVLIDELLPYYISALTKNFERVKLIDKGKRYYDEIGSLISKQKKQIKTRFMDRQKRQTLTMIENKISYLKKVLDVYAAITSMSEAEYIKYLNKMNDENINKNLKMVRI